MKNKSFIDIFIHIIILVLSISSVVILICLAMLYLHFFKNIEFEEICFDSLLSVLSIPIIFLSTVVFYIIFWLKLRRY